MKNSIQVKDEELRIGNWLIEVLGRTKKIYQAFFNSKFIISKLF